MRLRCASSYSETSIAIAGEAGFGPRDPFIAHAFQAYAINRSASRLCRWVWNNACLLTGDIATILTAGNGFGFAVVSPDSATITKFYAHPYSFARPDPNHPLSEGIETANLSRVFASPAARRTTVQDSHSESPPLRRPERRGVHAIRLRARRNDRRLGRRSPDRVEPWRAIARSARTIRAIVLRSTVSRDPCS